MIALTALHLFMFFVALIGRQWAVALWIISSYQWMYNYYNK